MSDTDLIDRLAAALAVQIARPALSPSIDLWDFKLIGAYLKRSPEQVRTRIAVVPSFPSQIRIPCATGGQSNPLYKANEIIKWAESFML